jgi:hypothetical protein
MADLKEVEQALNTYIRPLTFPVGSHQDAEIRR